MRLLVAAVVAFVLVLAGCGASSGPQHAAPPPPSRAARMKAVVRAWSENLNAESNAAEAGLFSYPAVISLMAGPYGCYCLYRAEVVQFHMQLLCSAELMSIQVRGRYATAVFGRFGDRLLSKCDEPRDALTGLRFTIVRGKISVLKQVWWKPPGRAVIRAPGR